MFCGLESLSGRTANGGGDGERRSPGGASPYSSSLRGEGALYESCAEGGALTLMMRSLLLVLGDGECGWPGTTAPTLDAVDVCARIAGSFVGTFNGLNSCLSRRTRVQIGRLTLGSDLWIVIDPPISLVEGRTARVAAMSKAQQRYISMLHNGKCWQSEADIFTKACLYHRTMSSKSMLS